MSLYVEGDVPFVANGNCNNGNNGMNSGWEWIVGLAIIGALFGGFGGNGFGGGRGGSDFAGWQMGRLATTNDVASGFSTSEIMSDLNDIILGQAQMQNFINQGFAGINQTVTNGFAGVNNALCTLGYQNQAGFNAISRELADCCCTTQRNIDSLRFDMSKGFCDIVRAGQDNTRAILDYLTSEKIEGLRAENTALKGQISNDRQSAYIVSQLREPCPVPAYVVQPPQQVTFATNCCGNTAYAGYNNNGCGCGCNYLTFNSYYM